MAEASVSPDKTYRELARIGRLASDDVWPHLVVSNRQILCRDRHGVIVHGPKLVA